MPEEGEDDAQILSGDTPKGGVAECRVTPGIDRGAHRLGKVERDKQAEPRRTIVTSATGVRPRGSTP